MNPLEAATTVIESFSETLRTGGDLIPLLVSFGNTLETDPQSRPQNGRLLDNSSLIQFEIERSFSGRATLPPCRAHIRLYYRRNFRIVVTVPKYYGNVDEIRRIAEDRGQPAYDMIWRFRYLLLIVLGAIMDNKALIALSLEESLSGHREADVESVGFTVDGEDTCLDEGFVTFSRPKGSQNVLIPDPYYYRADGYAAIKAFVTTTPKSWRERRAKAIWRGSATGKPFDAVDPLRNHRIRMATLCSSRTDLFDVKIIGGLKTIATDRQSVEAARMAVVALGVLGDPVDMRVFADYKFALHIDGNGSAWGLLEKMALGCCILRVSSKSEQWFEPSLEPWTHYVPISEDCGDLVKTLEFLTFNDDLAARIAQNALRFAVNSDPSSEWRRFSLSVVSHSVSQNISVSQDIKVCRLVAPLDIELRTVMDEGHGTGWSGVEIGANEAFRWTCGDSVSFRVPQDVFPGEHVRLQIPFLVAITPEYPSGCQIVIDDIGLETSVREQTLVADFVFGNELPRSVTLRTPPPVSPSSLQVNSTDARRLGLSVPVR